MNPFQLNAIKFEFTRIGLTEIEGMNLLDENGLISNNVIELEDIATKDAAASLNWLRQQPNKRKNMTFTETVTLTKIECGKCGAPYAILETFRAKCHQDGTGWHCPYCEVSWGYFNDNENATLRRKLEEREVELRKSKCATMDALQKASQHASEAAKAQRKLKRVHRGVCPDCNRTFENLARHMQCKHGVKPQLLIAAKSS